MAYRFKVVVFDPFTMNHDYVGDFNGGREAWKSAYRTAREHLALGGWNGFHVYIVCNRFSFASDKWERKGVVNPFCYKFK